MSRNNETGLVDYLESPRDRGIVELGYHAHHDSGPLYGGWTDPQGGGLEAVQVPLPVLPRRCDLHGLAGAASYSE